ncbi:winged helix-turn-helix transcriptional regulator [Raoultella terrigena]|uniref:winged helix-turn-helix transcriptional regulator n=1 Tax=Raoultella terrigena TaxID=577 RepID=UPI00132FCF0F|nr:helix-turn-helix domain-containing protein [Raoultella terrigena]
MNESIRHLKVPVEYEERERCLGPDGSVAHVTQVVKLISAKWTLPIFFRLCAEPGMRHSQFLKSMPEISHKVLTQHLRKLESDGLIFRTDFGEQPPRVEYGVTAAGMALLPVLISMREFSRHYLEKTDNA